MRAGLRRRTGTAAAAALVVLGAAACGGSSTKGGGIIVATALAPLPTTVAPAASTGTTPAATGTPATPATPSTPATTTTAAVQPTTSPSGTAATNGPVTAQYTKFWRLADQDGSLSKSVDPQLASVATPNWVNRTEDLILIHKRNGQHGYGTSGVNVTSVTVSGTTATVNDCHDFSGTGLMDSTGKKLNQGMSRQRVTGTLVLAKGVWKVSKLNSYAGASNC